MNGRVHELDRRTALIQINLPMGTVVFLTPDGGGGGEIFASGVR